MASKAKVWFVIVLFVCINYECSQAYHSDLSREEELELQRQLELLNKPSITTFQTKEGDIIDCVDINKQPALDHPSLKNHKVQTRPSSYPFGLSKDSYSSKDNSLINNNNRACPVGSVPIRRTLKKDLIRIRSLSSKQPTGSKTSIDGGVNFPYDQNVASLALKSGIRYYGASGSVSVYNLSVAQDQSSSANIWIVGGPLQAPNVILAGWQVNPKINGDSRTRMFVYWTADGGKTTGCYNTLCRGFVQTNPSTPPNIPLYPSSTYQGQQYDYSFIVYQDRASGNWWLAVSGSHTTIGYWPKELFGHLTDGADQVAWGGIAKPSPNGMSPPLGNGHKINSGKYDEACYFKNINYINASNKGEFPDTANTVSYVSNTNCYDLDKYGTTCGGEDMYYCFTFGGPGGNKCSAP